MRRCGIWLRRAVGLVGLPNIGKSTLFNAMTGTTLAKTGNYPFCTIDANVGKATVADDRLDSLASLCKAPSKIPVEVEVIDVAGLVQGASRGVGLGNKFLADVRRCAALFHVVRCFGVEGEGFDPPTPLPDVKVIEAELLLADMDVVDKRLTRGLRIGDAAVPMLKRLLDNMGKGILACRISDLTVAEQETMSSMNLLTAKPMVYVLNIAESAIASSEQVQSVVNELGAARTVAVCGAVEEQCAQCEPADRDGLLEAYGLQGSSIRHLLKVAQELLGVKTFFTAGPKVVHAWEFREGATARQAAGVIHSDFESHFTAARVLSWKEMMKSSSLQAAEQRMCRVDAHYTVADGDVIIVEHSATKR